MGLFRSANKQRIEGRVPDSVSESLRVVCRASFGARNSSTGFRVPDSVSESLQVVCRVPDSVSERLFEWIVVYLIR